MKKYFLLYVDHNYSLIEKYFIPVGYIIFIFQLFFYAIYTFIFNMPDSFLLRYVAALLGLGLIIIGRNKKLNSIQKWYFEICMTLNLPILFNTLLIINDFSYYWVLSCHFAPFIFGLLLKPIKSMILWPIGIILSVVLSHILFQVKLDYDLFFKILQINIVAYFLLFIMSIFHTVFTFSYSKINDLYIELQNSIRIVHSQKEKIEIINKTLNEEIATKNSFFKIISHDLRSPFNVILGFSKVLLDEHKNYNYKERKDMLQSIFSASNRSFQLIENLLEWSNIKTSRFPFNPKIYNIKEELFGTLHEMEFFAKTKKINFEINVVNDLTIYADKNMLQTILRNIISNSIKNSNKKSKITIDVERIDNVVSITISDEGVGMSLEIINRILYANTNLDSKNVSKDLTLGLGLKICQEFIKKHKGTISVKSELGVGSIFILSFPDVKPKVK